MLNEIIRKELEGLKKDFEKNKEAVEALRKYEHIEFGEFSKRVYISQGSVAVFVEEEDLKKAIKHFRPQFSEGGRILNVWHYLDERFSVTYGFGENFSIYTQTKEPKKYLNVDCKVVERVEKTVVCERS